MNKNKTEINYKTKQNWIETKMELDCRQDKTRLELKQNINRTRVKHEQKVIKVKQTE